MSKKIIVKGKDLGKLFDKIFKKLGVPKQSK